MSDPRPPLAELPAAPGRRGRWRRGGRSRRRNPGIALVEAILVGLIAVIAALVLATRLLSSRFSSFSRSETFTAREAAEYGLNEMQAVLNSDQYGWLWVTPWAKWTSGTGKLTKTDLNNCGLYALNDAGSEIDPALPTQGIETAKTISSGSDRATVQYQVTGFTPPALPDSNSTTLAQANFCTTSAAAANFGNLQGGSALITVTGTVTRGTQTTTFRLSRRTHVGLPNELLNFSFMIQGNAYDAQGTGQDPDTFGNASDISLLRSADGDICYGTPSGCFTTKVGKKNINQLTVIGCYLLDSCQVNNIDIVSGKTRSTWCTNKKTKKKKKGFLCNTFQQAVVITMPPSFKPPPSWDVSSTGLMTAMTCITQNKDNKTGPFCQGNGTSGSTSLESRFPYYNRPLNNTPSLTSLTNADLVKGCYFDNTDGSQSGKYSASSTTAINCIFEGSTYTYTAIKGKKGNITGYTENPPAPFITGAKGDSPNLIVDTSLLPVNLFLYDTRTTTNPSTGGTSAAVYSLESIGINNSDSSTTGWTRLRILGKPLPLVSDPSLTPISCNQSRLISTKDNDINGAFVWLPNGWLDYNKTDSKDSSYNVIWSCKFTGPTKGKGGYTIITPVPEELVRLQIPNLGTGLTRQIGSTYRAQGTADIPTP